MDEGRLINIARAVMADRRPEHTRERGHLFHHGLRTARIARRLLARIDRPVEVAEGVVFAAALFHDVGKPGEPHNEVGAARTAELLAGELGADDLSAAGRIVREHNQRRRRDDCWVASRIVQDADVLDHVGAQGVWLGLHWNAARQETPQQCLAYHTGAEHLAWLAKARASLSFPASLEAFDRRLAFGKRFFEQFAAEMEGEL